MKRITTIFLSSSLLISSIALSAYETSSSDLSETSSPAEELSKVKRQVTNLFEMKLPEKMTDLQEEIQVLRGSVEKQANEIKILKEKLDKTLQELDANKQSLTKQNKTAAKKVELATTLTYEKAIQSIREKRFSEAQNLLVEYLAVHPNDKLSGSAHFWLGEVYYQQNKKMLARREFEIIKRQYPNTSKIPLAFLKLGYIELDEENFGKAKTLFTHIIKTFPKTPAAHLARIKLSKLGASPK